MLSLITVFGCFSSFASTIVDSFNNPTGSGSYGPETKKGSATELPYMFNTSPQSGFFQLRNTKNSYIANTDALPNGTISDITFTMSGGELTVYGLESAADSKTAATSGVKITVVTSGKNTISLKGYKYFAIVSTSSSITKFSNFSVTWEVTEGVKVDFTPDWADMTVYKGTTASLITSKNHPNITFTSSNPAVASVDAEGVVSGLSNGTTEITATWAEDDTYSAVGSPYTVTVTVADRPLERIWNVESIKGTQQVAKVDHDFLTLGDAGVWHAFHNSSYVTSSQLGSTKNTFRGGTVSLIETDIPEDAYIKEVALTINSLNTNGNSSWTLSVNDINAEGSLYFDGSEAKTLSFNDVCIQGNKIKLTCTDASYALFISKLYVRYAEYTCPHAYETLTPTVKVEKTKTSYKLIFNNVPEGVEMYCKHTPENAATRAVAHNEYTKATVNEDGSHSFEVSDFGDFSYYGYHPETDTKGMVKVEKIDLQTAVEGIAAETADVEMFNLNGVKVKASEAAAGIYIVRQGSKIRKVVVK